MLRAIIGVIFKIIAGFMPRKDIDQNLKNVNFESWLLMVSLLSITVPLFAYIINLAYLVISRRLNWFSPIHGWTKIFRSTRPIGNQNTFPLGE